MFIFSGENIENLWALLTLMSGPLGVVANAWQRWICHIRAFSRGSEEGAVRNVNYITSKPLNYRAQRIGAAGFGDEEDPRILEKEDPFWVLKLAQRFWHPVENTRHAVTELLTAAFPVFPVI